MGNINANPDNPDDVGIKFDKKELKFLYKNFMKLDSDQSGLLEPNEFFINEELKDNPIIQRIISVFDKNNDGKISFYEFVSGLSCLTHIASSEEKIKLAFRIYDVNDDGIITNGDLFKILKMLVDENIKDIHIQQMVDRTLLAIDKDQDGKISFHEFSEYCKDLDIYQMFSMNLFTN